jgi:hypothetical protein
MTDTPQRQESEKALAMTRKGAEKPEHASRQTDTADEGPIRGPNPDAPVPGAFDAEGHRPVLERSRKVR